MPIFTAHLLQRKKRTYWKNNAIKITFPRLNCIEVNSRLPDN